MQIVSSQRCVFYIDFVVCHGRLYIYPRKQPKKSYEGVGTFHHTTLHSEVLVIFITTISFTEYAFIQILTVSLPLVFHVFFCSSIVQLPFSSNLTRTILMDFHPHELRHLPTTHKIHDLKVLHLVEGWEAHLACRLLVGISKP